MELFYNIENTVMAVIFQPDIMLMHEEEISGNLCGYLKHYL